MHVGPGFDMGNKARKGRREMKQAFNDLWLCNPVVHRIMREGGTAEDCAVWLAEENKRLGRRVMELENIAPRKVRNKDGIMMIWRCPAELVPEVKIMPEGGKA